MAQPPCSFAGLLTGLATGTALLAVHSFTSSLAGLGFVGIHASLYVGIPALVCNLVVALLGSVVAHTAKAVRMDLPAPEVAITLPQP